MNENSNESTHTTNRSLSQLATLTGAIGPVIALILLVSDIEISPWFSWYKSALSDLGVHSYGYLFNSALIIEGILNIIFMYALHRYFNLKSYISGILLIAGISLALVGVFNEHFGTIHLVFALIYFILFPSGIIMFSLSPTEKRRYEAPMGIALSIIGLGFIIVGILQVFKAVSSPLALGFYEFIEALALIIWSVEVSISRTASLHAKDSKPA